MRSAAVSLVLVLLMVSALGCEEANTEDVGLRAREYENKVVHLWNRLAQYQDTYLLQWKRVFEMPDTKEVDVVDAFNTLAYKMTGPDGLWRNQVPKIWLGCAADASLSLCERLVEHEEIFREWDEFQEKIARLEPRRSGLFLIERIDDISAYLDRYIIEEPNPRAMRKTRFFRENLSELIASAK